MYIDINFLKKQGYGTVVYHPKQLYKHNNLSIYLPTTVIKPILFLSCSLIIAKKNYWLTELKISGIV